MTKGQNEGSFQEKAISSLAPIFKRNASEITSDKYLKKDFGASSVEVAAVIVDLSRIFDIKLNAQICDDIQTKVYSNDMNIGEFIEIFKLIHQDPSLI